LNPDSSDALKRIDAALNHLPAELRDVLVLKDKQGVKYHEVARRLGISVELVKERLRTARIELGKLLQVDGTT
jgi:RNA polymerase sigma factor (sigma-70 family)